MHDDTDRQAPGHDHEQAGDAGPGRAPGDCGRGDLSDTDRQGSHGQAESADELSPAGTASRGGGVMSSQGLVEMEDTEDLALESSDHRIEHVEKRSGNKN